MVLCCTFNSGTVIVRTTKRRGAQHFQSLILSLRPARNTVIRSSVILLCVGGIAPITDPGDRRNSSPRRGAPASVEAESISLWSIHDGWRVCCSALGRADSVCSACAEQGAWSTTVSDGSVRAPMGYQGQAKRFAVCNALYRQRHCRCDNISRSNARPPHSASSEPKHSVCAHQWEDLHSAIRGGCCGALWRQCGAFERQLPRHAPLCLILAQEFHRIIKYVLGHAPQLRGQPSRHEAHTSASLPHSHATPLPSISHIH